MSPEPTTPIPTVVEALKSLIILHDTWCASDANQEAAYYIIAKQYRTWEEAKLALKQRLTSEPAGPREVAPNSPLRRFDSQAQKGAGEYAKSQLVPMGGPGKRSPWGSPQPLPDSTYAPEMTTPTAPLTTAAEMAARRLLAKVNNGAPAIQRNDGQVWVNSNVAVKAMVEYAAQAWRGHETERPASATPFCREELPNWPECGLKQRVVATLDLMDKQHLLAASTGARGAVVEEIVKRHEADDAFRAGDFFSYMRHAGMQAHEDRAQLLALIGAKQP